MNKLIGGIALLFLVGGAGSSAHADGPWCAFYDASTYNCGFYSFEQCYETVRGAGGSCRPNFFQNFGDRPAGRTARDTEADVTDPDQTSRSPSRSGKRAAFDLDRPRGVATCAVEPSADLLQRLLVAAALGIGGARQRHAGPCSSRIAQFSRRCASLARKSERRADGAADRLAHSSMPTDAGLGQTRRADRRKRRSPTLARAKRLDKRRSRSSGARDTAAARPECAICGDRLARGPFQTEFREATQVGKSARAVAGDRWGARTATRYGARARFEADRRRRGGHRGGDHRRGRPGISVPDRLARCILRRLFRHDGSHLRRQRDLRRLPSGRSAALARLAASARHATRKRQDGAGRFLRRHLRPSRRAFALLSPGRKVSRRDRRA